LGVESQRLFFCIGCHLIGPGYASVSKDLEGHIHA
jgi:hypothetical protein